MQFVLIVKVLTFVKLVNVGVELATQIHEAIALTTQPTSFINRCLIAIYVALKKAVELERFRLAFFRNYRQNKIKEVELLFSPSIKTKSTSFHSSNNSRGALDERV